MGNKQQTNKNSFTKIGRDAFRDGVKLPDPIEIRDLCYKILRESKKMPSDAVIKNRLKGGGIIRYKRDKDMVTICVADIMTTEYARRKEINEIAKGLLAKVIKSNPHLYITMGQ